MSDLFIAKRIQQIPMKWLLFDAYKVDYNFDMEIFANGMIETASNGVITINGTNFFAERRMNLRAISLPCGLVVNLA